MTATRTEEPNALSTLRGGLPDHYLTPEDLTVLFRLPSVETVYAWRKKRIGPPAMRIGKYLRYDPSAVRAWAESRTETDAA
ncbi:helix-turn-helix domain-containing protein [Streptomyces agglomeratus]|uniref:helix-turn-helix domain-containing protein n=1 Tax=Streptomyces agglomeratus TaxID=285458 RepID=UPI000853FB69|nr:helix-turn-helix domain-containing protein [Streptomyces agglomeratus]OEJ51989.1 DNA-binding protein [Streptomyces agglomeratus]